MSAPGAPDHENGSDNVIPFDRGKALKHVPLNIGQQELRLLMGPPSRYNQSMKYRHSPLVETIFEVFAVVDPCPEDALASIEAALLDEYSGHRDVLEPVGLHFQVGPGLSLRPVKREQEPARVRLWTPNRERMVQFAPDMCALNILPKYSHYMEYQPRFERLTKIYLDAAKPSSIARLGQRYINKICLPKGATPDRFFEVYPAVPERIHNRHPPFSMQVEVETLEVGGNVVLTLTAKGIEDEQPVYVLDLYARSQGFELPTWDLIREWQDAAHKAVIAAFEMAITEDARDLFGQEEQGK